MSPLRWTGRTFAKCCAWCGEPLSEQDAEAIRENPEITVSHGLCRPCKELHFAVVEPWPTSTR